MQELKVFPQVMSSLRVLLGFCGRGHKDFLIEYNKKTCEMFLEMMDLKCSSVIYPVFILGQRPE